ncbi:DNA mismatch repair protein MutS [Facklamia miroungae]|uniref:DNA mismatch repair protein MutS n=1 Tax=Facklamia miroungae TaxID=120956 RepID=A0A1G7PNN7_9LACT|nr:DNA mismatch repair protein MutS [Facklamia miroungae]NKZ28773.1 DNA mismatch repair protein MutS [Facklamia miroungae]SDF87804.1 DNA mismatch repair protein MutS [Facklamia miroungae]
MSNKETPMMQQYLSIKAKHQDAILFFRLGDFYEMFFEDAITASRVLEITLTSRNKKAEDPVPMCGVPYHSATDYIRRLIQEGFKVAICEQLEDPRLTKGMVKRDVVQIITPGTILVDQALKHKENNYLAAFAKQANTYYFLYVDISTGQCRMTQTEDWNQFVSEIQTVKPSEWIIDEESGSGFDQEELIDLQERINSFKSVFTPHSLTENFFTLKEATPAQEALLKYLSAYLKSIQPHAFDYLKEVEVYTLSSYLQMNQYTKVQLELTESLRTQKRKGSLLWLIDQTQTAMGGRLLHQWLDKPLLKKQALINRHQKVAGLIDNYFIRLELIAVLKNVYDLERLVTKLSLQTANAREVDQLRQSLSQIPTLNHYLAQVNDSMEANDHFDLLPEFKDLLATIDEALVDNPPISLTEGRIIKDHYHKELDGYRDALDNGESWLLDYQERERQRTGLKTLKVGYNKVFGYYLEMSRLQANGFDDPTYVRKQTLANNERYITDELKKIESTILGAQEKAEKLEYHLFINLRNRLNAYASDLQDLAQAVATLDVLCSFAALSEEENFTQAQISDHIKDYAIEESRHPVLEKLIGKAKFIANDFHLDQDQFVLLLTGPNMSGKSTYMRQIAYSVILNQIGCFVPAKKARLPLVDQIFTRIGSSDDLTSGQSTFMVEMIETNYALQNATDRSLILFDEIGRGTATFDGIALAEAILFYIAQKVGAATIFSTHYHELTDLDQNLSQLKNIHVGAVEEAGQLVFLYKILAGPADKSYGIHVGRLAGLPESVLVQSQQVLDELEANAKHLRNHQADQVELFPIDDQKPINPTPSEVELALKEADVNQMTPLDALNFLAQLKHKIK